MDDADSLNLPAEARAELDAMPPEQRHAYLDWLHARHAAQVSFQESAHELGRSLDRVADLMRAMVISPLEDLPEDLQNEFLDFLMCQRMRAEWTRAVARGDDEAAQEHLARAEYYDERSKGFLPRLITG